MKVSPRCITFITCAAATVSRSLPLIRCPRSTSFDFVQRRTSLLALGSTRMRKRPALARVALLSAGSVGSPGLGTAAAAFRSFAERQAGRRFRRRSPPQPSRRCWRSHPPWGHYRPQYGSRRLAPAPPPLRVSPRRACWSGVPCALRLLSLMLSPHLMFTQSRACLHHPCSSVSAGLASGPFQEESRAT